MPIIGPNALKRSFLSLSKRGVWRSVRLLLFDIIYEHRFGANTSVYIPSEKLDFSAEARSHAPNHFPARYLYLHEALSTGRVDCHDGVFVDYGSGSGRALLFASTLPFKKLIGLELSSVLCAAAVNNLKGYYARQHKKMPTWEVINIDARAYEVPNDANIFFFYNPFDEVVLEPVIERILASIGKAPRRCWVVYLNPQHKQAFLKKGFVEQAPQALEYAILSLDRI